MPAPPGYFYRENDDGALCFEENCPGYTMTTITWTPAPDLDGVKAGSVEVPTELLRLIVEAYTRSKNESRKPRLDASTESPAPAPV